MSTRDTLAAILAAIDAAPLAGDPDLTLKPYPTLVYYEVGYRELTALIDAHGTPDHWVTESARDFDLGGGRTRLTWTRILRGRIEAVTSPHVSGLTSPTNPWGDPLPEGWRPVPPKPVRITTAGDDPMADEAAERDHGPGRWEM